LKVNYNCPKSLPENDLFPMIIYLLDSDIEVKARNFMKEVDFPVRSKSVVEE
jgi:hypothetical protein